MICPSCGTENPDSAAQCSKCKYKFRFGHAYNDPAQMTLPDFTRSSNRKNSKIVRYLVLALLFAVMLLVIILTFKQASHF